MADQNSVSSVWVPKGLEYMADILSRSADNFFVYFDPDPDGLFSGYLVCRFLNACGKTYETYINENRAHGFLFNDYERLRDRTVIAVDFSITEAVLSKLAEHNVKLINIDHHDIESDTIVTYSFDDKVQGVVINNQYRFEPEEHRYLSGCGAVFYTLCQFMQGFDTDLHKALVGLTLLTDMRPLENEYAKYFLKTLYTCKDKFIIYLYNLTKASTDYTFGAPRLDRNFVDYSFSPKVNALFRFNKGDIAIKMLFGQPPTFDLTDLRDMQNRVLDYIKNNLKPVEKATALSHLQLNYIPNVTINEEYSITNFIGLACSQLKGQGVSTVTYVGTDSVVHRGSFRGKYDTVDYLAIFRKYGIDCAGHTNAFGIKACNITEIDFKALNDEIAEAEEIAKATMYENRIVEVTNLAMFLKSDLLKQIAVTNNYVRDTHRVYLKYTGTDVKRKALGKMWEFSIDGVKVKCFSESLNTTNGLILPMYEREALTLFLKDIKN